MRKCMEYLLFFIAVMVALALGYRRGYRRGELDEAEKEFRRRLVRRSNTEIVKQAHVPSDAVSLRNRERER